jgi:hypothetical protein
MATTGLEVFDKTLQMTNIWLDDIMAELGPAAYVGVQLPLLIRGLRL